MRILSLISIMIFAGAADAASVGTLRIQGEVGLINELAITPTASATQLDLIQGGGFHVATVRETSNNLDGYRIEISSANGGFLVHAANAATRTPYTLSYDSGAAVSLTTLPQTVKTVLSVTGTVTNFSAVAVTVTALPAAPAGVYADDVTISIVAR